MRTSVLQICVLLSILLLVGCDGRTAAPLPRTPTPATSSPTATPAEPAAPLSLYIGGAAGTISALNAADGTARWRTQLAQASRPTIVALDEGVVYASAEVPERPPSTGVIFYALRASDGTVLWHQMLPGAGASVVAVRQGVVYLALGTQSGASSPPSAIEALRAQDGSAVWHTVLEGSGPIGVVVTPDTLYVTSFSSLLPSPGYYYAATFLDALSASSGAVQWHRQVSRTNVVAAVTAGQVYLLDTGTDVVCEPRVLHVLDARTGAEQWQREGSFLELIGVEQALAVVEAVPAGCTASFPFEGELAALHTPDGSSAWQRTIPFGEGAIAHEGVLYVPSGAGDLAAYSAEDGVPLWRAPGAGGGGIDLFAGALYTSGERGLDAISPSTGAVKWRYATPDGFAVLGVANGIVYAVVAHLTSSQLWDSAVLALRADTGKLLWRVGIGMVGGTPLWYVGIGMLACGDRHAGEEPALACEIGMTEGTPIVG